MPTGGISGTNVMEEPYHFVYLGMWPSLKMEYIAKTVNEAKSLKLYRMWGRKPQLLVFCYRNIAIK